MSAGYFHHDHEPLNGGICPACEQIRDDERQYHYDLGREIAWEVEMGRLDDSYLTGLMSRVRAGDAFTQDEEWPEMPS